MNLFRSASPEDPAADPAVVRARRIGAYKQGQRDAARSVNERASLQERDTAVRQAYDRGRRDERARHPNRRGSPFIGLIVLLAAAAGVLILYLAYQQGGFANGGRVVDQNLANTTASATQATRTVVDKAGDALQNAGQTIKQKVGSGNSTN
jgi:hypothetical protein